MRPQIYEIISGGLTTRLVMLEPRTATCRDSKFFVILFLFSKKLSKKEKD